MRHAPSMTGLRALEAVLRNGTLSAAARELCVTPAAISHRLRDLEDRYGTPLVYRAGARFEATELGRAIAEALGDAFQRIRVADELLHGGTSRELRITASYSFAVMWLMPRISSLETQFFDADLTIHPTHAPLVDGPSDVTIVHSARPPEPTGWTLLFQDRCAAVARSDHPFFLADSARLRDILGCRLVHITHQRGPEWGEYSWRKWADTHGLDWSGAKKKGSSVSAEHMAADMLLCSDIFGLISVVNASRLLAARRLRAVPGSEAASGCSYWISCRDDAGPRSILAKRFVDWMVVRFRT
jgi:LysR family transcriptional regulator, glycine cleavage system transcriptional activator